MSTRDYRFGGLRDGVRGWAWPAKSAECTPAIFGILGPDARLARPLGQPIPRRWTREAAHAPSTDAERVRNAKKGEIGAKTGETGGLPSLPGWL